MATYRSVSDWQLLWKLIAALEDVESYLDQRADADVTTEGNQGNEEMLLLRRVRAALALSSK